MYLIFQESGKSQLPNNVCARGADRSFAELARRELWTARQRNKEKTPSLLLTAFFLSLLQESDRKAKKAVGRGFKSHRARSFSFPSSKERNRSSLSAQGPARRAE